jgi:hypothetical protein
MKPTPAWIFLFTLLVITALTPGCGGSGPDTTHDVSNHNVAQLTSVRIFPQTADAQDFSGGLVTFMFDQTFSGGCPSGVACMMIPPVATWCVAKAPGTCAGINDTTGAQIYGQQTGNGIVNGIGTQGFAQCKPGFSGQVMILAGSQFANPDSASFRVANPPAFVVGSYATATLTCP